MAECCRLASLLLMMLPALDVQARAEKAMLYVAEGGNDAWSGELQEPNAGRTDGPFATLERARDELRRRRQRGTLPERGCRVEVRGGRYRLEQPFELTAEDSGTADARITYRAESGAEVRLVGGRRITNFVPVTDAGVLARLDTAARGHVVQADLKALGITD